METSPQSLLNYEYRRRTRNESLTRSIQRTRKRRGKGKLNLSPKIGIAKLGLDVFHGNGRLTALGEEPPPEPPRHPRRPGVRGRPVGRREIQSDSGDSLLRRLHGGGKKKKFLNPKREQRTKTATILPREQQQSRESPRRR